MFAVETLVFVASLLTLLAYSIGRDLLRAWRDGKQAAAVKELLASVKGHGIEEAVARFGSPTELLESPAGGSLYVWIAPPSRGFPKGRDTLVVTLTVDETHVVRQAEWRARSAA